MLLIRRLSLLLALAPLLLIAGIFIAVLRLPPPAPWVRTSLPHEPLRKDSCTWYCHNHGCPHSPVLPAVLSSDRGLFGQTIHALYAAGAVLVPGSRSAGYGAANLLFFCLLWPGLMYCLYLVALHQQRQLRERGGR